MCSKRLDCDCSYSKYHNLSLESEVLASNKNGSRLPLLLSYFSLKKSFNQALKSTKAAPGLRSGGRLVGHEQALTKEFRGSGLIIRGWF